MQLVIAPPIIGVICPLKPVGIIDFSFFMHLRISALNSGEIIKDLYISR
jgi:hypothetical protein